MPLTLTLHIMPIKIMKWHVRDEEILVCAWVYFETKNNPELGIRRPGF